jgi:acetyl-CoA carboxylase carboxyl transferase subunit alpha
MSLKVPNISIIIGEGGSGGAIALASSNKVIMLEHSIYSVISPEGCASILWRDPGKSLEAAEAMKLTAKELLKLGIIDEVIKEPLGGAHRDSDETSSAIKKSILKSLKSFEGLSGQDIFDQRKMKFLKIGRDRGFKKSFDMPGKGLGYVEPSLSKALRFVQSKKNILIVTLIMLILTVIFNVLM